MGFIKYSIISRGNSGVCSKCGSETDDLLNVEISDESRVKRMALCENCAKVLYHGVKKKNELLSKTKESHVDMAEKEPEISGGNENYKDSYNNVDKASNRSFPTNAQSKKPDHNIAGIIITVIILLIVVAIPGYVYYYNNFKIHDISFLIMENQMAIGGNIEQYSGKRYKFGAKPTENYSGSADTFKGEIYDSGGDSWGLDNYSKWYFDTNNETWSAGAEYQFTGILVISRDSDGFVFTLKKIQITNREESIQDNVDDKRQLKVSTDSKKYSADYNSTLVDSSYSSTKKFVENNYMVGDHILFGKYEQDNDTSNGKEEIEWLVLSKEDNKVLLVSEYALDCKPFNNVDTNVTWETCSLRWWLNNIFYYSAFSTADQERIDLSFVSADPNPVYDTYAGNNTYDKVFLLSLTEVKEYLENTEDIKCIPTAYAINQGSFTSASLNVGRKNGEATITWWLRTPGSRLNSAENIDYIGGDFLVGSHVDRLDFCVRPALWLKL